jgi:hypothetical protein
MEFGPIGMCGPCYPAGATPFLPPQARTSIVASPHEQSHRAGPPPTSELWRTDQRSTPPSITLLYSVIPPPSCRVTVDHWRPAIPLYNSSVAASLHCPLDPIKGRRLRQLSPHPPLSFPHLPRLERYCCRTSPPPLLPRRHPTTTPLPEAWSVPSSVHGGPATVHCPWTESTRFTLRK